LNQAEASARIGFADFRFDLESYSDTSFLDFGPTLVHGYYDFRRCLSTKFGPDEVDGFVTWEKILQQQRIAQSILKALAVCNMQSFSDRYGNRGEIRETRNSAQVIGNLFGMREDVIRE
jgi:hypothetical protein